MAAGQPQTIAGSLIDRLNELRRLRPAERGVVLEQIRFQSQGLKSSDRPKFLAVRGMIAALDSDLSELESVSTELQTAFPYAFLDQMNVLRSFASLGAKDQVKALAERLSEQEFDFGSALSISDCLLVVGDIEGCLRFAVQSSRDQGLPMNQSPDALVSKNLLDAGVTSDDMFRFLTTANSAFGAMGWDAPPFLMALPVSEYGDDDARAIIRFIVKTSPEEGLEIEDQLMDSMIEAGENLFMSGIVACAVTTWPD